MIIVVGGLVEAVIGAFMLRGAFTVVIVIICAGFLLFLLRILPLLLLKLLSLAIVLFNMCPVQYAPYKCW